MDNVWDLYKSGKSIGEIAARLELDPATVEAMIIDKKLTTLVSHPTKEANLLEEIMVMGKAQRLEFIEDLSKEEIHTLENEIKLLTSKENMNYEDIVSIVWIIGELKLVNLSEFLCRHSSSNNGNIQRIVYSSMGKLLNNRFVPYLKMGCKSHGVQVRMYAIKSLSKYDFDHKNKFFMDLFKKETNMRNQDIIKLILEEVNHG